MTALVVRTAGVERRIHEGQQLTFGREADLVLGADEPAMHRVQGRFQHLADRWWIENLGSTTEIAVRSTAGTRLVLGPNRSGVPATAGLVEAGYDIEFEVRGTTFHLRCELADPIVVRPGGTPSSGRETLTWGHVTLTEEDRQMLVVLAENELRMTRADPAALPSNRQAAHRLGWGLAKFNRKLDYLCTRLTKSGVDGLYGGSGGDAATRRIRLVHHALTVGLITIEDLPLLDEIDARRSGTHD